MPAARRSASSCQPRRSTEPRNSIVSPASVEQSRGRGELMAQRPPRILLIEDDSVEAALISDHIIGLAGRAAEIVHVARLEAGLEQLAADGTYDVILLDLNLPDGRGIENLQRVQAMSPVSPVIILTNMEDQGAAVAAVAEGA